MKDIDIMEKIAAIMFAAVAAVSCAGISSTELYTPDEIVHKTGEVTLCLSLESMDTKVDMDDLGHFMFKKGDEVAVMCKDGSFETFTLDGSGDTKRAFFKGVLPEGKTLGDLVVFPVDAAERYFNNILTVHLPNERVFGEDAFCSVMAGRIGEDYFVDMRHISAYLEVSVENVSSGAGAVAFTCPDKLVSGYFNYDVSNIGKKGIAASEGNRELKYLMPSIPGTSVYSFPIPEGDYSELDFITYDQDGNEVSREVIEEGLSFSSGSKYSISFRSSSIIKGNRFSVEGAPPAKLNEVSPGIWEAYVDSPAQSSATLVLDGIQYGFKPFSGAGGLGSCMNEKSALPYYNFTVAHDNFYYVEKSYGEVALVDGGASPFWIGLKEPARIHFVYDSTRPSGATYYLEVVKDNPEVIFDEQFDLFTFGGDANFYIPGTSYSSVTEYDGLTAGTRGGAAWNATADGNKMFDYPAAVRSALAGRTYMSNRGVDGWTFVRAGERPGGIQLNQGSNYDSYLVTPEFSSISGSQNAEVTLQISRFSATSKSEIYVDILGDGSFTSGHVRQTAYTLKSGALSPAVENSYPSLEGSTFAIGTDFCVAPPWNDAIDKPVSTFTFQVSGLTSRSQIRIRAPFQVDYAPRCIVFGIRVEKK